MAPVWGNMLILVFVHFVVSQRSLKCGEPTKYLDKQLENSYRNKTSFNDREKVVYKCFKGYTYSGRRSSYCRKGKWTLLNMTCQKIKCNGLADIENGEYIREGQMFEDKAIAKCKEGYVLRGERVRMCLANGWNGTDPICEESKVTCSAPRVENRWVKPGERTQFTPQDTLIITCSEGFDLIGPSQVTCGPDGQWQALPECRPKEIQCSEPKMANGKIHGSGFPYKHKATVDVRCSEGFDLIGPSQVTCGPDGQWQALPECRPKEIQCLEPKVANGKIQGSGFPYKPKAIVDVRCSEGFDLIGSAQVTCDSDGQWQALPECRPKKISGNCGPAPSHPNTELRDGLSRREYPSGARVRYRCSVGYRRARGSDGIVCDGGKWTRLGLQCERKKCGSAGEISFGRFEYTGVLFGDSAKAICQEGYELIGPQMRTCRDGGWDGRVPMCEPVHCAPPPEVKDAEMSEPIYEHVPFGRAVSYECRSGTLIGASEIYCTQKGTWSAPPPECKNTICPHPRVAGGSRMRGYRAVYRSGNTVVIACNPGLRRVGEFIITCGTDGKWTPDLPVCV